jgi:hypothetical protein
VLIKLYLVKLEKALEALPILDSVISFSKTALVGTLKPAGQMSLAPPSFQAGALFESIIKMASLAVLALAHCGAGLLLDPRVVRWISAETVTNSETRIVPLALVFVVLLFLSHRCLHLHLPNQRQ